MPSVIKRLEERHLLEVDEGNPIFLNTIKFPKNLHYLTERLPAPNYEPLKVKRVDKAKFVQTVGAKAYSEYFFFFFKKNLFSKDEENSFEKYKKNPENLKMYKKPQPELSPANLQPKDDSLPEINPNPMKKKYKKKTNNNQVSVRDLELRLANKNKKQEKLEEKSIVNKNDKTSLETKVFI